VPIDPWSTSNDFGIIVDPQWISLSHISNWIKRCDEVHTGACHHLPAWERLSSVHRLILIDVKRLCLVELQPVPRYFALSYVWGTQPNLMTMRSNFATLQEPGILGVEQWRLQIPGTILDAMSLSESLGFQYLWVDRLCIIQDGAESKSDNINAMGSIYSNAYVTIVASGGDNADHGLLGIGGSSAPRNYRQIKYDFTSNCRILVTGKGPGTETKYHHRGWTFQEELLSPRILIFERDTVFWHCRKMNRYEDIGCEVPEGPFPHGSPWMSTLHLLQSPGPQLQKYGTLVQQYSRRVLSFPEDRLRAFSGVLEALCIQFKNGFHFGLPVDFFDFALLWDAVDDIHRISSTSSSAELASHLPSWSWVGWEGDMGLYACAQPHYILNLSMSQSKNPDVRIHSLVKWYIKRLNSEDLVPINNSFYEWRELSEDPLSKIPEGWSRETRDDEQASYFFRHESHHEVTYRYMVPLVENNMRASAANERDWQPYLFFSAQRSYFRAAEFDLNIQEKLIENAGSGFKEQYYRRRNLSIVDRDGNLVGVIQRWLVHEDANQSPDLETIELIAISRMTLPSTDAEEGMCWLLAELFFRNMFLAPDEAYDFYNVLYVERLDGIAYRKSIGRVLKSAWEANSYEKVDVVLG
jgi:hypothetical protein